MSESYVKSHMSEVSCEMSMSVQREHLNGKSATSQTWKRTIFFTPARFEQKIFYPRKCVTCDKSEFATKQRKMCLTTSMSKIILPHIYRSNNYVIIIKKILF